MTPMVPFSLITKEGTGINSFAFFDEISDLTILGGLLELFGLYSPLCCISSLNLLSVAELLHTCKQMNGRIPKKDLRKWIQYYRGEPIDKLNLEVALGLEMDPFFDYVVHDLQKSKEESETKGVLQEAVNTIPVTIKSAYYSMLIQTTETQKIWVLEALIPYLPANGRKELLRNFYKDGVHYNKAVQLLKQPSTTP